MELRNRRFTLACAAAMVLGLVQGSAMAQGVLGKTVAVDAQDEYAQIEVEPSRSAMERLRSPDAQTRFKAADEVLAQPSRYNPAVLFAMSDTLFERGRPQEGVFWFAVANTRAVADAQIITDRTAVPGVVTIRQVFGTRFREHLKTHPQDEWPQVSRAIEWDRANPPQYDRRWLALHGIRAVSSALAAQEGKPDGIDEITVPQA
ncbi:hypothetical protein JI752_008600 [Lysobacter sp. MMG2]|uniref:hypothetical protein n=1 Tax=Lysobacter sp. MMG2 TaxID=2801338 RepID=UPI001C22CD02|nr:hypothetical protein [Lysobacter sp. MMG2]MBU8976203.1 hypothetical protein [Lysobacter sp. MMG2]